MNYLLAVLSHGEPRSPYLEETLRSFHDHVTPTPSFALHYHDGRGEAEAPLIDIGWAGPEHLGFCRATQSLWDAAVTNARMRNLEYVFWLEHDFRFERHVDLVELATVLHRDEVAQVSLMRDAVNKAERKAGGVVEANPDAFAPMEEDDGSQWLRHRAYFTTNPSLMRVEFMENHPFAAGPSHLPYDIECEGRYGLDLKGKGFSFAVWGDGSPWVTHTGTRDGVGY